MTWEEVTAYLRQAYVVLQDTADAVTLGWKAGTAVQLEQVERVEVEGQPWLRILSLAGPQSAILPEAALAHNLRLAIGALALASGSYVLRHFMPLAGLGRDALDQALQLVAYEAARLTQLVEGHPAALSDISKQFAE